MKKLITLILALAVVLTVISGCSAKSKTAGLSPEELEKLYAEAITGARDDELNDAFPVTLGSDDIGDEVVSDMLYDLIGFTRDDAEALAMSVSLMNVNAYGIVVVKPAEGREETVRNGLQSFIDRQCESFERYLPDQYEIAQNARLETLDGGTVVMVMCDDKDTVYNSIATSIQGD